MGITDSAARTVGNLATRATTAAGALGGAAVGGAAGAVRGAANGVTNGVSGGAKSTPAAALAITALGVTGLVDWPLLLAAGGTALVLDRLTHANNRSELTDLPPSAATSRPTTTSTTKPRRRRPTRTTAKPAS